MKKITVDWLEKKNAYRSLVDWFSTQKETDGVKVAKKLMEEGRLDWANWIIINLMTHRQQIQYTLFVAEQMQERILKYGLKLLTERMG